MPTEAHKEETSKPTWLHLIDKNDLETQVKCEKIKQVFKRKSIFKTLLLKLRIILKILQENDTLAKKKWAHATIADPDIQVN